MDFREKAFALVQETTKLLITLATGFIAFTVAFSKDFMKSTFGSFPEKMVWSAGSLFLVLSVACGIWTLLGITTVLAPPPDDRNAESSIPEADRTIRHTKIKKAFALQLVSFGIGVILMGAYQALRVWKT
jgi:hypothetical protein